MASDNPSSNLERAAQAAEEYENKHYQGGELDAQDFKKAGEQATAAVSDAATAVKEAVVGPSEPKVSFHVRFVGPAPPRPSPRGRSAYKIPSTQHTLKVRFAIIKSAVSGVLFCAERHSEANQGSGQ